MEEKKIFFYKWAILVVLVIIWGSSYILMKRALGTFSPMQVGALRIAIAFIFLLPIAIVRFKKVPVKLIKLFVLVGLLGSGIPAFLFATAQTGIDSQIAGILNSVAPLFTLLIGVLFFRYKTKWFNVLGVFIGLAGAIGLLSAGGMATFDSNLSFGIYIIIATILYSYNTNIIKTYLKEVDALTITSVSFVFIGIPCLVYLFAGTDIVHRLNHIPGAWTNLGYMIILAAFGTALAGVLYNYLIKISSVIFAASVTYVIPIVAVIWGSLDGEKFYIGYFLWISLIFLGIYLVNRERK